MNYPCKSNNLYCSVLQYRNRRCLFSVLLCLTSVTWRGGVWGCWGWPATWSLYSSPAQHAQSPVSPSWLLAELAILTSLSHFLLSLWVMFLSQQTKAKKKTLKTSARWKQYNINISWRILKDSSLLRMKLYPLLQRVSVLTDQSVLSWRCTLTYSWLHQVNVQPLSASI